MIDDCVTDDNLDRESAKLFLSSRILSGLGSVASQEIGELINTWVARPGQAWSVIFRASEHGYQVRHTNGRFFINMC